MNLYYGKVITCICVMLYEVASAACVRCSGCCEVLRGAAMCCVMLRDAA
jgi:hypothetical protein